jgi:hypothetical protein
MSTSPRLKKRRSRSPSDLRRDSRTVCYELDNLIAIARQYSPDYAETDRIRNNAYIESFAIHCRALIFFLYGHQGQVAANGRTEGFSLPRDTDVLAWDFHQLWEIECPEPDAVLVDSKQKADKYVAHITTLRRDVNQPGSEKSSVWRLSEATSAICKVMECFIDAVPPDNFDAEAMRIITARLKEWSGNHTSHLSPSDSSSTGTFPSCMSGRTTGSTLPTQSGVNTHGKTD